MIVQLSYLTVLTWALSQAVPFSQDFCSNPELQNSLGRAWIETHRPVYAGHVTRAAAVVCSLAPFVLQIWESSEDPDVYKLVWELTVQPQNMGKMLIPLSPKDYYNTTSKHRIGLSSGGSITNEPISVLKKFDFAYPQLAASNQIRPFRINNIYRFADILRSGSFLVDLCGDDQIECPKTPFTNPFPDNGMSSLDELSCSNLQPSQATVHLQPERPLPTGVTKALRLHLCTHNAVRVQLWDSPDVAAGSKNFTLVWEKQIQDKTISGKRRDTAEEVFINLDQSEYVYIKPTYRLGIQSTSQKDVVSIAITVSTNGGKLASSSTAWDRVRLCQQASFDDVTQPYEFLVDFCHHKYCAKQDNEESILPEEPCPGYDVTQHEDGAVSTDGKPSPNDTETIKVDPDRLRVGQTSSAVTNAETSWLFLSLCGTVVIMFILLDAGVWR